MTKCYIIMVFLLNIFLNDHNHDKNTDRTVAAIDYNLSAPDKVYPLPESLREISGITETDASSVACIQDEKGFLFIYDLMKEKIRKQYPFSNNGDYEGITRVGKTVYILRSDGMLFEIFDYESEKSIIKTYSTGIPANDNEGLCYDKISNRLLIAPKSNSTLESDDKNKRCIFAFDLKSKKLVVKPLFVFHIKTLVKFASENKLKVPMKSDKKGDKKEPDIEFRPSALGIHPITNKLFILSGMEKLLFVFNMKGEIEYIVKLDPDLFPQPEGITFLNNGDMLISNEDKKPTILRFNYLKK
jgi:uncharacterized protein YjiK